jgi:hypothetical protein
MMASSNPVLSASDLINCTSWSSQAPQSHLHIGNGSSPKSQDFSETRLVPGLSIGVAAGYRGLVPDPFRYQDRVSNSTLVTLYPFSRVRDTIADGANIQICYCLGKVNT